MTAPAKWNRLDNAAKIFPPTSTKRDTKVFRFACELTEPVDAELLQQALDQTLELFPFYRSILKKGLFWYYLEESNLPAEVHAECEPPCSQIYDKEVRTLLFQVTYYQNRINLELYHALSDGAGAMQFLRVLVYHYLLIRHPEAFPVRPPIDYDASMTQKADDSFRKYYVRNHGERIKKEQKRAFRIKGARVPENRIQIIRGTMPVRAVSEIAHQYGATITALIAAVFMCSIQETMSLREKRLPVVLTVPVNLRQYFPSESARNFFSVFEVKYCFDQPFAFQDVVRYVNTYFRQELTGERMMIRMNALAAIEHNAFVRPVPRAVKDFFLRIANLYAEMGITAALSNIGKVTMPPEMASYIRLFDVFVSTKRVQICMCSYQDRLTVSFSSAFESTEIQKNFFRSLTTMGVPVSIAASR